METVGASRFIQKARMGAFAAAAMLALSPVANQTAFAGEPAKVTASATECKFDATKTGSDVDCKIQALKESQKALENSQTREACLDTLIAYKSSNPDVWKTWAADKKYLIKQNPCAAIPELPKKTAAAPLASLHR